MKQPSSIVKQQAPASQQQPRADGDPRHCQGLVDDWLFEIGPCLIDGANGGIVGGDWKGTEEGMVWF